MNSIKQLVLFGMNCPKNMEWRTYKFGIFGEDDEQIMILRFICNIVYTNG